MKTRDIATAVVAVLVMAVQEASAGGLQDACIVRSIDQIRDTIHVLVEVDRSVLEQQVRASAQSTITKIPGLTLGRITLAAPDPTTLRVEVDYTAKLQVGPISQNITGTVKARGTISIVDASVVHADLLLDSVSLLGQEIELKGLVVGGFSSRLAIPGTIGRLERVQITSVEPSWIGVAIDVHADPP